MKSEPGPPVTLGSTAAALVVWCRDCGHQVEPDPGEVAERCGADTSVRDWQKRLVCSRCGGRAVDFVLTGARRWHGRKKPAATRSLSGQPGQSAKTGVTVTAETATVPPSWQ